MTSARQPIRPVVLVILDGWGIGRDEPGNAVLAANTPVMDRTWAEYPHTQLITSGNAVGLPEGQMGNSEVGHLNIGAGFIVYQWISRIDKAILDGEFATNPVLQEALRDVVGRGGTVRIGGLVSDGGVHSHTRHIVALVETAKAAGVTDLVIDAFTDGRDTSPTSGLGFVSGLESELARIGLGSIATVSGRYYAMDRDKRWDRTRLAYDAITLGAGETAASAAEAIQHSYDKGVTDEFILPTVIGKPTALESNDLYIMANFRSDRCRQITAALTEPGFEGFARTVNLSGALQVLTMTEYEKDLPVQVIFPPHDVVHPLARVVSEAGLKQFHSAETEKYPHVTFFLNGGREEPFPGEDRALIPSPKVATYDLHPEMSAEAVGDAVVAAIDSGTYAFVVVNFANADMVGHTGSIPAVIKAVETADTQLGRVLDAVKRVGGAAIVIADHGNAEEMIDHVTGGPMTAHTTNPVPCIVVGAGNVTLRDGSVLSTVAPTILDLLDLPIPPDMTTPSLLAD